MAGDVRPRRQRRRRCRARRGPAAALLAVATLAAARGQAAEEDEEEVDDQSSECWTYGDMERQNPSMTPQLCCSPPPCGVKACWAPPEFTYDFCCQESACRPSVAAELQRALDVAVDALPSHNASAMAFKAAPAAFKALLQGGLRGLRLVLAGGLQGCLCAIAYAVAVLLEPGLESRLPELVLTPRWLLDGVDWGELVAHGWGGLFAILAQPRPWAGLAATSEVRPALELRPPAWGQMAADKFALEAQRHLQAFATSAGLANASFPKFVSGMRAAGAWQWVWQHLAADLAGRRGGRRCAAVPAEDGAGAWTSCSPWSYSQEANYSSPLLQRGTVGQSSVAVCVLGAPRNVVETYGTLRRKVIEVVHGDAFVYVPFADRLSTVLERELTKIGPAVTAIAVRDVDRLGMEERVFGELQGPPGMLRDLYSRARGPWRAPVYGQMGSSFYGYHTQHVCRRMVLAYERQRGDVKYEWVIFARADLLWVHTHPPVTALRPGYVYVPFGQDNSHYAEGPLMGLNDRHAVVPRDLVDGYFGRWEALCKGEAWQYLKQVAEGGFPVNTEQYLLLHLRAVGVPVRRFPPVAFVVHCAEGPQCLHLYKATNLRKQRWTQTAKYWTEVIETRRSLVDRVHYLNRNERGWIWVPVAPQREAFWPGSWAPLRADLAPEGPLAHPWEIQGADLACCLSRSGPVSCRWWDFLLQCRCVPG